MASKKEYVCTLDEKTLDKAKRELNEDPTTRQVHLDKLREMFNSRPDIKFRSDDAFLLRFLRCKKFSAERAFKTLVRYYETRRDFTDIYGNFVPSRVEYILKKNMHYLSVGRDSDGRRVFLFRPGSLEANKAELLDGITTSVMVMEKVIEEDETQVNGVVVIGDLNGMTMGHATCLGPTIAKKLTDLMQNALPVRLKAFHYVNQPAIFDAIFAIFKPFLGEKMKKRLHFHGEEVGDLHKYVPSQLLPAEYGGAIPEFSNKELTESLMASEQDFIENSKYGFPKSKDALGGASVGEDPAAGLKGSFKKLEI
ncbi:alpha-tocopherol transfer protein-like [Ptychodera flava]|uniref:alpha-tocopherol transfer protein-like n=1 Tax=Ptychodera flava TaxID=63121 RepID=UPI00396A23D2